MNHRILKSVILLVLCIAGISPNSVISQTESKAQNQQTMNSYIAIFEIPATDLSRAVTFYEQIMDIKIEQIEFPELKLGLFPTEGQMVTGVIIQGEDYQPSAVGSTIYLNAGNDLQVVLDKVEKNGGKILVPKTPHADEFGFFALFLDSEGNKVGLHSPN